MVLLYHISYSVFAYKIIILVTVTCNLLTYFTCEKMTNDMKEIVDNQHYIYIDMTKYWSNNEKIILYADKFVFFQHLVMLSCDQRRGNMIYKYKATPIDLLLVVETHVYICVVVWWSYVLVVWINAITLKQSKKKC